ncbi:MAG: helix-turn-helix domain-containing protein [Pseudomonadota bacterium]
MDVHKAWIEPDLTIKALSKRMETTEHKLRALINQRLDYDNFSAFVNAYRVKAIKAELLDPKNANMTILAIALNNGFNSVPPFNQAFKALEGITPSQYRTRAGGLAKSSWRRSDNA